MIRREVVAQADHLAEKNFVALAVILDDGGGDYAVGNRDHGTVFGAEFYGAEANVFDHAALIANAAGIANLQSFVGQNGNTTEQIFKRFLRAETDGQAANTKSGECCCDVHSKSAENNQQDNDEDQDLENAARKGDH